MAWDRPGTWRALTNQLVPWNKVTEVNLAAVASCWAWTGAAAAALLKTWNVSMAEALVPPGHEWMSGWSTRRRRPQ